MLKDTNLGRDSILKYNFLKFAYIDSKDHKGNNKNYEYILCELLNECKDIVHYFSDVDVNNLNASEINFEILQNQSKGEADIREAMTNYELDFKLMISNSLAEVQSKTIYHDRKKGITVECGIDGPIEVISLYVACSDMTEIKLQKLRIQKNKESKSVLYFFDKVINVDKNILIFIPIYFWPIDYSCLPEKQHEIIFNKISLSTKYIYTYRNKHKPTYDTFIVYLEKINTNKKTEYNFIISKCTANGLKYIGKVNMFCLKTIIDTSNLYLF